MPAYSRILLPWDRQPQEAVGLNHEVFAGTGRIGSWITSGLNPTVIDGRNAALVSSNIGTMSAGVGQGGLGIEGTASSSEQRLSNAHFGIGSTDYWLQITFEQRGYRSLGSGINVLGGYGTGWGVSGAWLYQFSDNKLAATMDGTATTIAMAVALPNGTHTATLFSIGTTAYFYVDGQLIGTTTKSTPSEIGATRFNLCSDIASSNALRTWNGRVYGAHFGIGTLSQAWAAFASANPWQLFAPQSIWVPVSAGGGGGVNLVIADSAHAHAADNIGLTLDTYLAVNEALHAHTADNLTLSTTGSTDLTVADSAHAQALDNVVLTSQAYLAVADMLHAHALDGVTLTLGGASLTVAELLHAHALDGAALTLDTYLEVDDAVHGHTLDGIVLTPVGTDAVAVSLGGRAKPHRKGLRFQDYDVPLPPEVLTSTIPQDTPPTGIKPAPSLSAYALRPASKLATRPARVKAPKAQAPAPAPVATPESQATPAVAIVPVVAAAAPVSAAAKPPRAMALADILSAQDLTHDELLQAVKLLARELQDGPALRLVRSHRIALRR